MTTPVSTPAKPKPGSQKKILGVPRTYVYVGGAVLAAALVYFLIKRRQAAAAGSGSTADSGSTDASGTDFSGELSTIEQQLQQLAADQADSGGGGGGTVTSGGGGDGTTGTTGTTGGSGSDTGQPTGTTGTTGTTGGSGGGGWSYPAPTSLKNNAKVCSTCTQLLLTWSPVTGPQGQHPATYTVRIFRAGQQIRSNNVAGTNYTENGLAKGNNNLTVNVWANGGPIAPPHATLNT